MHRERSSAVQRSEGIFNSLFQEDQFESIYSLEDIDNAVKRALSEHIDTRSVRLFFRPGNHRITKDHLELIENQSISWITGELEFHQLLADLEDLPRLDIDLNFKRLWRNVQNRLENPGIGSSTIEDDFHTAYLQMLLADGVAISSADSSFRQLKNSREIPPHLIGVVGKSLLTALLGSGAVAGTSYVVSRREMLKYASALLLLSGMTIGVGGVAASALPAKVPIRRSKGIEGITDAQIAFEQLLNAIFNNEPMLGPFTEVFIKRRNEIISLNLWHIIGHISEGSENQENILAYFGAAHGGLIDVFLQGPSATREKVAQFAKEFCNSGVEQILEDLFEEQPDKVEKNIEKAAVAIRTWADFFPTPIHFSSRFQANFAAGKRACDSARTVLIEELVRAIEYYREITNPSRQQILHLEVLNRGLGKMEADIEYYLQHYEPRVGEVVNFLSGANNHEDQTGKHETQFVDLRSLEIDLSSALGWREKLYHAFMSAQFSSNNFDEGKTCLAEYKSELPPALLKTGLVKVGGVYLPSFIKFSLVSADKVEIIHGVNLLDGRVGILSKQIYRKIDPFSSINIDRPYLRLNLQHQEVSDWKDPYRVELKVYREGSVRDNYSSRFFIKEGFNGNPSEILVISDNYLEFSN